MAHGPEDIAGNGKIEFHVGRDRWFGVSGRQALALMVVIGIFTVAIVYLWPTRIAMTTVTVPGLADRMTASKYEHDQILAAIRANTAAVTALTMAVERSAEANETVAWMLSRSQNKRPELPMPESLAEKLRRSRDRQ